MILHSGGKAKDNCNQKTVNVVASDQSSGQTILILSEEFDKFLQYQKLLESISITILVESNKIYLMIGNPNLFSSFHYIKHFLLL